MNYKIKVKGSFDLGTPVSAGGEVIGIVCDRDDYESEISLVDLVSGLIKYRGKSTAVTAASAAQFEKLLSEKSLYLRSLSTEEKIFFTVSVYNLYGMAAATELVQAILKSFVDDNASHDAIREYGDNINFIFETVSE